MNLIKPPHLNNGDSIGIVAPCLPLIAESKDFFITGKNELIKLGYKVKTGKTLKLNNWWSAGTPRQQAEDIMKMYLDINIKAIWALSGGYSAISVLDQLDYGIIRNNPKPFIGMSDMTIYHLAILSQSKIIGFHMDEVCYGLGMNWQKLSKADLSKIEKINTLMLSSTKPLGSVNLYGERKTWRGGAAEGRLIGGNLNSLSKLVGTKYFPKLSFFDGAILFWEAVGLHKYEIYQMLQQLKYAGIFERITGMVVGTITAVKPAGIQELKEPKIQEILIDSLKEYQFPILKTNEFGHYTPNIPMPIGIKIAMNATKLELKYLEAAVI